MVAFGTLLAFDVIRIVSLEGTGLTSVAAALLLPYALCRWGSGREAALGLTLILSWLAVTHIADPTPPGEVVAGVAFFLLSAAVGAAMRFQAHAGPGPSNRRSCVSAANSRASSTMRSATTSRR